MRRIVLAVLAAAVAAVALSGCGAPLADTGAAAGVTAAVSGR